MGSPLGDIPVQKRNIVHGIPSFKNGTDLWKLRVIEVAELSSFSRGYAGM